MSIGNYAYDIAINTDGQCAAALSKLADVFIAFAEI
jgi:hypothetical protein